LVGISPVEIPFPLPHVGPLSAQTAGELILVANIYEMYKKTSNLTLLENMDESLRVMLIVTALRLYFQILN